MPDKRLSPTQERSSTSVADAYAAFIADRQAANVTVSTLAYYHGKLRRVNRISCGYVPGTGLRCFGRADNEQPVPGT